jgi:hypothetical protein
MFFIQTHFAFIYHMLASTFPPPPSFFRVLEGGGEGHTYTGTQGKSTKLTAINCTTQTPHRRRRATTIVQFSSYVTYYSSPGRGGARVRRILAISPGQGEKDSGYNSWPG